MKGLLIKWVTTAIAVGLTAALFPGITVNGGFGSLLVIALIWGLIDSLIGPIARLLSLPITVMTLGLFLAVVNGALFALTAWFTDRLDVDNFLAAIGGALVIAVVTLIFDKLIGVFTKNDE